MTRRTYAEQRDAALAKLAAGDVLAAFHELRPVLQYPRNVPPDELVEGLGVLARIMIALDHHELAERAAKVSLDGLEPELLFQLGYQLIEDGLPGIAVTVLTHCLEHAPGHEQVVTELVSALERSLAYADARRVLEAHPELIATSFLCRYLLAYNGVMSGDLGLARRLAPGLIPTEPEHEHLVARIVAILDRADRVATVCRLDDTDLRGWHYVLTGGVLTHLSPYGFDEPMRGRYAWLQDSPARVRTGIDRLARVLAAWRLELPCIFAPPGRDHEIVAAAASELLGVPRAPWPAVGVPAPGLVVAYDLDQLSRAELMMVHERRPDQLLYAHATGWTVDGAIAADVTTLLHQSIVPPWGAQLELDPVSQAVASGHADDRDPDALGRDVAAAAPLTDEDVACDDLDRLDALVAAVGVPPLVRRERAWAGSPVLSNRFD